MRWKIIAVNAGIVIVVGLLTYLLLWTSLDGVLSNHSERKRDVGRTLRGADAQLSLDALRWERWLSAQMDIHNVQEVFSRGTPAAREESATAEANELYKSAVGETDFAKIAPSLVLIVDQQGLALGRNGSNLMRGENISLAYPSLGETLKTGVSRSDVWLNRSRGEQMLASYAAVRGTDRTIIGAVVVGTPLNDERLARTADLTSGFTLFLGIPNERAVQLIAKSGGDPRLFELAGQPVVAEDALAALSSGNPSSGDVEQAGYLFGATPLSGYGKGKGAVLIAAVPVSLVPTVMGVLWPVLAVTFLGLVIVTIAGNLLGNYWARPIADIEEGLLMIMNGRTDMRFDMEHPELGGLVFRINSLLNALTGTPEDTTDDQGRPSRPPRAGDYQDALSVDESSVAGGGDSVDPKYAASLAAEPSGQYYSRVFAEYVAAKGRLGEDVSAISEQAFVQKLRISEAEMSQKHGKSVRYRVESRANGVVLIAVPLPARA